MVLNKVLQMTLVWQNYESHCSSEYWRINGPQTVPYCPSGSQSLVQILRSEELSEAVVCVLILTIQSSRSALLCLLPCLGPKQSSWPSGQLLSILETRVQSSVSRANLACIRIASSQKSAGEISVNLAMQIQTIRNACIPWDQLQRLCPPKLFDAKGARAASWSRQLSISGNYAISRSTYHA